MSNHLIKSVRYYQCGFCTNQLAHLYKGFPKEVRQFPAGVFLIEHATEGYTLFDTGYSRDIFNRGVREFLYQRITPPTVTEQDEIPAQLARDGIDVKQIRRVVLSHLHPDHIGGVKFFPDSELLLSAPAYTAFSNPRLRDLIFPALVPKWFAQNVQVISTHDMERDPVTGLLCHDVFGDGSMFLSDLAGHAAGQMGAYIPDRLLLAADASWGNDLLPLTPRMKLVPRAIQQNYAAYRDTATVVREVEKQGIPVYFSHGQYTAKELLT